MKQANQEQPILDTIKAIKDKTLNPKQLSKADRRRCVDVLRLQGSNVAAMAKILQVSERTIMRDVQDLKAELALEPHPQLLPEMVGQLVHDAEAGQGHLRRLANNTQASVMERLMAEQAAWKILCDLIDKLQSLGYLPRQAHGVVAQIQHRFDDPVPQYQELAAQLNVLSEAGIGDADELLQIQDEVQRGQLAARIEQQQIREDVDGDSND